MTSALAGRMVVVVRTTRESTENKEGAEGKRVRILEKILMGSYGRRMPGAGNRLVTSSTSAKTLAVVSSSGLPTTRSIHSAISFISASPMPRLVTDGVPRRMPDGSNGLRVSYGTEL